MSLSEAGATRRILVINPNSNVKVTEGLAASLAEMRIEAGPAIECVTLEDGPHGIESQQDVDRVAMPLCRLVANETEDTAAFVIACFSDPGLHATREGTRRPVFGIAESGLMTALTLGDRVGVISILQTSLPRHARYFRSLGVAARVAGDLPINAGVGELQDEALVLVRMISAGKRLRGEFGANVLLLGCAGMARYRNELEQSLEMPVVDPAQAAVGMAITAILVDYKMAR